MIKKVLIVVYLWFLLLTGVGFAQDAQQAQEPDEQTSEEQQMKGAEEGRADQKLSPKAVDRLRMKPEIKSLQPRESTRKKETREGKTGEGKTGEGKTGGRRENRETGTKQTTPSPQVEQTFFERYRVKGKFQDVSTTLKPFGYEFFQDDRRTDAERVDIPVPSGYVVGPGDEVKILMWGRVSSDLRLVIDRNGNITIPQVGPIHVAGMTFEQMSKHLIKQAEQMVGANIDVTMGSLKSIPIFVLGDVKRPGSYTIGSFATITDALLIAGGPSGIGSMRNIQLRGKDKGVHHLDLYDLFLKGDKSKDLTLQAGDVVFVPLAGPVAGIAGNVRRPAIYELKGGRDLNALIDLAGGIVPTAYTQQIQVERVVNNERQVVIDVDGGNPARWKKFQLEDTDLVKVFNIVGKEENIVFLQGNVKRPGKYEFKPGMTLRDLVKDEKDLLPETYLDYASIKRMEPPTYEMKTIPVNLKALFTSREYNVQLLPQDNVFIFSTWFFRDKPFVIVEGEVRGSYLAKASIDEKTLDNLRKAGITRLDDPRLAETGVRGPVIDQAAIDELRRLGIMSLDDPRLTQLRGQIWPGTKEIDQKTTDELRRLGITNLDDPRIREMGGGAGINQKTTDELRHLGIKTLDDPRVTEVGSQDAEKADNRRFLRIPLTENMRVRDAILAAGGLGSDAYQHQAELYRTDNSRKTVILVHFNIKKVLEGDPQENLVLKANDRIVINSVKGFTYKKTVAVDGDVVRPGSYVYAENMKVRDLVFAAGNVLEGAYLDQAEVTSQLVEDDRYVKLQHRNINLKRALEGDPEHDIALKPYDRLTVKRLQDWRKERFATIGGEVNFPGRYVARKNEKLSALIERAGGYSDDAYLRGAVFTRVRVKDIQRKALGELISKMEREALSPATASATANAEEIKTREGEIKRRQEFIDTLRRVQPTGRMTIYLANLRLLKGSEYDIELEEGDSLFIPKKNSVVTVTGAVLSGGSYVYSDGMKYEDYIKLAGGYGRYADTSNVFVMKVDGSARKLGSSAVNWNPYKKRWEAAGYGDGPAEMEAGDSIIVPEKLEKSVWIREIRDIAQIFGNLGLTAATVAVLWKTLKDN